MKCVSQKQKAAVKDGLVKFKNSAHYDQMPIDPNQSKYTQNVNGQCIWNTLKFNSIVFLFDTVINLVRIGHKVISIGHYDYEDYLRH